MLFLALLAACGPPSFRPPNIEPATGPEALARGAYLGEHVTLCVMCHSERDWTALGGPSLPGSEGQGGTTFNELFKLPDEVSIPAPNITPLAIGDWSDGELARAITGGLAADGSALFPSHPYFQFRGMARSDLAALVAWMRTLPPGERTLPERDLVYAQVEAITNSLPLAAHGPEAPPEPGTIAAGRYLAKLASCEYCHSPTDALGFPLPGQAYSGGSSFEVHSPGAGRVYVPNITPDPETGIGRWSREDFIQRFRKLTPEAARATVIEEGGFNSPMPWASYSGMSEEDLGAVYDFLMSRRPMRKAVKRWEPPTEGSSDE